MQDASAQEKPFKPGDLVFGPCSGFGGEMDVHYYDHMSPLRGFAINYGLPYKMDSGFFSVGLMVGLRNCDKYYIYPISIFGTKYFYDRHWSWVTFSTRVAYHIDLLHVANLDTYVGTIASYSTVKITYTDNLWTDPTKRGYPYPLKFKNFIKYGIMLGARYDIYKSFGVFGEASTGITWLTVGASYKY